VRTGARFVQQQCAIEIAISIGISIHIHIENGFGIRIAASPTHLFGKT
jgi:hypothetical protein